LVRWDAVAPQQAATQGESHLGAGSRMVLVVTGGADAPRRAGGTAQAGDARSAIAAQAITVPRSAGCIAV
jgi:hypothetical protein